MSKDLKECICNINIKQNLDYLYNCALENTNYAIIGKNFCFDNITNYIVNNEQENITLKQEIKNVRYINQLQHKRILELEQQLKDKDEKISKVREYCNKEKNEYVDDNDILTITSYGVAINVLEILESNKED